MKYLEKRFSGGSFIRASVVNLAVWILLSKICSWARHLSRVCSIAIRKFLLSSPLGRHLYLKRQLALTNPGATLSIFLARHAFFLREPISITEKALVGNKLFLDDVEANRNRRQTSTELARLKSSIVVLNRAAYLDLQTSHSGPRIICTFHFGNFVYGLNALMCLEQPQRNRMLLSQEKASPGYFANISNCFGDRAVHCENQLLVKDTNTLQLCQLLRSKQSTLIMFCDLPQSYGEFTEVSFLNRRAFFPKGPAVLAFATRALLVPVISYTDNGRNIVHALPTISPRRRSNEDSKSASSRITQLLINVLEEYLIQFPEQWRYLQLLPSYFHKPN
jgi:hypothetical protein